MNTKIWVIILYLIGITNSLIIADYLIKDGKTKIFNLNNGNLSPSYELRSYPAYLERKYPYQRKSDYTSFGSDRSYRDPTNRNMGNRQ